MLPAYKINPMLDVSPISNALDSYQKQMNTNAQLDLQERRDTRDQEQWDATKRQKEADRFGRIADMYLNENDPTRKGTIGQGMLRMNPNMISSLQAHGIDTNNLDAVAKFLKAESSTYNALDERAKLVQIDASRASAAASVGAERRANAMHGPQLEAANLAVRKTREDLDNPVTFKDIGPDHAVVGFNKRTAQEVSRVQGPPKSLDSTTRKAIYEAQDELPNIKSTIDQLNEAQTLLPTIYTGFGSSARTTWNQGGPGLLPNMLTDPKRAQSTQRYNQIMNAEAIQSMSNTLKGASTDKEMAAFVSIINDPNSSTQVKQRALDTMIRKANAFYQNKQDRIRELGGRMPNLSGNAPSAPQSARPRAVNPQTGQTVEFDGTQWVPAQ